MTQFPGAHCAVFECHIFDFLPITCNACKETLCSDHISYESHRCVAAEKFNNRVPVCPLCDQPVPTAKNENPDKKVGEHIDRDCKSDPAKAKRNKQLRCSLKECRGKELVPMHCSQCHRHFCLKHRHFDEHSCMGNRKNPLLKELPKNSEQVSPPLSATENDEELAKALHAAMNGDASFDGEERSRILARKLANMDLSERNRSNFQSSSETSPSSSKCSIS